MIRHLHADLNSSIFQTIKTETEYSLWLLWIDLANESVGLNLLYI